MNGSVIKDIISYEISENNKLLYNKAETQEIK